MDNPTDTEAQEPEQGISKLPRPQKPGGWQTRMPWIMFVWVALVAFSPGIFILLFLEDISEYFYKYKYRIHSEHYPTIFRSVPFFVILHDFLYDIMRNTTAARSATLFSALHIAYWCTISWWFNAYPDADHSFVHQWEIVRNFFTNL